MSITLSESSKIVVENITKMVCELMTLKIELISEKNQDTEKQQKQSYVLNQVLQNYSLKKKDVLNEIFKYTPCMTTFTEHILLLENGDISSTEVEKNKKEEFDDQNEEYDNQTESDYEFSDVDEDETIIVNKVMAKATTKLRRNRQTKKYIHITTTY